MEPNKEKLHQHKRVTFSEGKDYQISDNANVTVLETEKKIIIKNSWKISNNLGRYRKKKGNTYFDERIKEYKSYQMNYYKSKESINRNMRRLEMLINLNFHKYDNILFITLTCENMVQDIKVIKDYWRVFIRKLRRKYSKYAFLYILKYERQKNGNWHIHCLIKDIKNKEIYITNNEIHNLWGYGYTYTQFVKDGYINTNYEEEDNTEEYNNINTRISSYMAKTTQLFDVPNREQIYSYSKNIQIPKATKMPYYQAKEKIKETDAMLEKERVINVKIDKVLVNRHKQMIYKKQKK